MSSDNPNLTAETYSAEQVVNDIKSTTGQNVDIPPGRYRSLFSRLFGRSLPTQSDLPHADPKFVERLSAFVYTQQVRGPRMATPEMAFTQPVDPKTEEEADGLSSD